MYKKKLFIVSILVGVLALTYAATLIFSADRRTSRSSLYVWLEPKWAEQADRLELSGDEQVTLVRRNGVWYAELEGREYPAKQTRIDDLFQVLSSRAAYPVRGGASSSQERLGLTEALGYRIVVRGGVGAPLLDLLIGSQDVTGREVYLRKNNHDEIRSGEDGFSRFLTGARTSWYDLKLLGNDLQGALTIEMIQRVTVILPVEAAETVPATPRTVVITRSNDGWTVEGISPDSLDNSRIEPYLRAILDAEGDDFVPGVDANDPVLNEGRITIEFGNGTTRSIRLGPVFDDTGNGKRLAAVSGKTYVYTLSTWMMNRLFRERGSFEKTP